MIGENDCGMEECERENMDVDMEVEQFVQEEMSLSCDAVNSGSVFDQHYNEMISRTESIGFHMKQQF